MISLILLCICLAASVHSETKCGVSKSSQESGFFHRANWRIYGGTPVKAREFPWQISIKRDGTGGHVCGGTIISDQWLLTAAHCGINVTPKIVLGDINFDDQSGDEVTVEVEQWITHPLNPKNDPKAFLQQYDLALIKIKTKLDFDGAHKQLAPVCLATKEEDASFTNKDCTATGFGYTEKILPSSKLLKVELPVWEHHKCADFLNNAELTLTERTVCAGGDQNANQGTCNGDSGGPIQCKRNDGSYVQIGVVSFGYGDGRGTCNQNYPNAFARVSAFREWILETISN